MKFEKVVEYKWADSDRPVKHFFFENVGYWEGTIKDWLMCIVFAFMLPLFALVSRAEIKKKVYWRKIK